MTEKVDLDNLTTQQVYAILGHSCKFEIGDAVEYSQRNSVPRDCKIIAIAVQYGKVMYINDDGKWGYEDQYRARVEIKTEA